MLGTTITNKELANGIRVGDHKVFEQLFRLYYAPLKSYARFILKNPIVAEELVQEIFIKIYENHSVINIDTSVKAYLYRTVHNQSVNYIKNSRVKLRLTEEAYREIIYHADLAIQNFSEELLDNLATSELENHLNKVIESLPTQCREIFLLNRQDELSYTQIASKLGISANTVKTQIMRALERLREAFKKF